MVCFEHKGITSREFFVGTIPQQQEDITKITYTMQKKIP